jgi:hypothetical protein
MIRWLGACIGIALIALGSYSLYRANEQLCEQQITDQGEGSWLANLSHHEACTLLAESTIKIALSGGLTVNSLPSYDKEELLKSNDTVALQGVELLEKIQEAKMFRIAGFALPIIGLIIIVGGLLIPFDKLSK